MVQPQRNKIECEFCQMPLENFQIEVLKQGEKIYCSSCGHEITPDILKGMKYQPRYKKKGKSQKETVYSSVKQQKAPTQYHSFEKQKYQPPSDKQPADQKKFRTIQKQNKRAYQRARKRNKQILLKPIKQDQRKFQKRRKKLQRIYKKKSKENKHEYKLALLHNVNADQQTIKKIEKDYKAVKKRNRKNHRKTLKQLKRNFKKEHRKNRKTYRRIRKHNKKQYRKIRRNNKRSFKKVQKDGDLSQNYLLEFRPIIASPEDLVEIDFNSIIPARARLTKLEGESTREFTKDNLKMTRLSNKSKISSSIPKKEKSAHKISPSARFDPYTGKPLKKAVKFDPMTGKSLMDSPEDKIPEISPSKTDDKVDTKEKEDIESIDIPPNEVFTVLKDHIRLKLLDLPISDDEQRIIAKIFIYLSLEQQEKYLDEIETVNSLSKDDFQEYIDEIRKLPIPSHQQEVLIEQLEYIAKEQQKEYVDSLKEDTKSELEDDKISMRHKVSEPSETEQFSPSNVKTQDNEKDLVKTKDIPSSETNKKDVIQQVSEKEDQRKVEEELISEKKKLEELKRERAQLKKQHEQAKKQEQMELERKARVKELKEKLKAKKKEQKSFEKDQKKTKKEFEKKEKKLESA